MKKILQSKNSRIVIIIALIVVALAEVLFRAISVGELALTTSNTGESIAVIVLASLVLFFTLKGNDKISYVTCGALVAYFVMDQLFELPGTIGTLIANLSDPIIAITIAIRLLTMVGIIAIAVLLVEYVNDGTICNKAFKVCYWSTILLHVAVVLMIIPGLFMGDGTETVNVLLKQVTLIVFNEIYRIVMVVLFTTFAYDSAKRQLNKTK